MATSVPMTKIDTFWGKKTYCEPLLEGNINEMIPHTVSVLKGETFCMKADDYYHVFILVSGSVNIETEGKTYRYDSRVTFAPAPQADINIEGITDAGLLCIKVLKRDGDAELIKEYGTKFPYIMPYDQSKQYWDVHKTKKTIPRVMLEQRNIPRVCMGSCESVGFDEIIAHAHPMLDQYFFSFPENHTTVSIDDEKIDYTGNVLMYIPLGSNHGSTVEVGNHLHYVWIDFFADQAGMNRLDTMHQATGLNRKVEDL